MTSPVPKDAIPPAGTAGKRDLPAIALRILPFAAALLLFVAFSGREAAGRAANGDFGDYDMYWFAATASVSPPGTDVYRAAGEVATNRMRQVAMGVDDPSAPDGLDPRYYVANSSTPFLFAAVARLSVRDLRTDFVLFQCVSAAMFCLFLFSCARAWDCRPWQAFGLLLLAPFLFPPFQSDVGNAAPTRILLGLLAASHPLLARGTPARSAAGGALLGVALLLKPLVIFVPPFLFLFRARRRMWRTLAWEGGGLAATVAAGALLSAAHFRDAGIWLSWAGRLRALPREALPVAIGNFSLTDLVMWVTGRDLSAVLPVAATVAILLAALFLPRQGAGDDGTVDPGEAARTVWFLFAMGCASFLVASPRAWVHYYLLSLPLLIALAGMESGGRRAVRFRRGLAALSAAMVCVVLPFRLVAPAYPEGYLVGMGFVMWGGVLLAWLAGARELARGSFGRQAE